MLFHRVVAEEEIQVYERIMRVSFEYVQVQRCVFHVLAQNVAQWNLLQNSMMTPASRFITNMHQIAPHVVSIRSDADIIAARMAARDVARSMGFSAIDQARIATATSELARNILLYAGEGSVTIAQIRHDTRSGIEMIFEDQGPGIANLDLFLNDGHPAAAVSGLGLAGTRRLMDEMDIHSVAGQGTTITCRRWLR